MSIATPSWTAVGDSIVFNDIAIGPKVTAPRVVTKQNADLAAVRDIVVAHYVVSVVVADGDAVISTTVDAVLFRQAVLHAPAPEDADGVAFESVIAEQRSLRPRSRMHAQVRVVVTVTVFNHDIMANLKADTVAVVVAGFDIAKGVPIAVLQEHVAAVITV